MRYPALKRGFNPLRQMQIWTEGNFNVLIVSMFDMCKKKIRVK